MEKNPAYAKSFRNGIKPQNFDSFWKDIADKLNPFGPPVRDGYGWHKVWKDMKFKMKKKLVNNKTEPKATEGGAYKQVPLSPLEEAVANLLQFEKQINPRENAVGFAVQEEVVALPIQEEETRNVTLESGENVDVGTSSNCQFYCWRNCRLSHVAIQFWTDLFQDVLKGSFIESECVHKS